MKSIDQKLIENKYRQKRKAYLEEELVALKERLKRENQTLERLKRQLDKESEDVERLEHASLNRVFALMSARSSLRLEKEKAEAIRAALDYKLQAKDVEYLCYQKNLLEQELKPYESLTQEYESLLEIKRKTLAGEELDAIRAMEADLERMMIQLHNCEEAYESGKKLSASFNYILDHLSDLVEDSTEAKSLWYPILSQEELDDVIHEIARLNEAWIAFEQRLRELQLPSSENFDQGFLLKVSDYMMESEDKRKLTKRINTSFEQLNATYAGVREMLNELKMRIYEMQHSIFDQRLRIQARIETNE